MGGVSRGIGLGCSENRGLLGMRDCADGAIKTVRGMTIRCCPLDEPQSECHNIF
jgi:hypothetical protein